MDHPGPGALPETAGTGDSSVPYIHTSIHHSPPPPLFLSLSLCLNTEYTECWPCPLFDILLNKYYPAGQPGGRQERPQCTAGAVQQGMYSAIPIHWNIKSAPASSGRSRVGPALYVFSLLGLHFLVFKCKKTTSYAEARFGGTNLPGRNAGCSEVKPLEEGCKCGAVGPLVLSGQNSLQTRDLAKGSKSSKDESNVVCI